MMFQIIKKYIFILFIVFLFSFALFLSSCSSIAIDKEIDKKMDLFISQRSFSLKFESDDNNVKSFGYGTAWLMGKNKTKNQSYYLGTNLHVAQFINNANKNYYKWCSESKKYYETTGIKYSKVYIGQIYDSDTNQIGTTNGNCEKEITYFHWLDINNISVEYTPIDTMSSLQLYNRYEIYNDTSLKNATIDFSILEIDFSQKKWNEYLNPEIYPIVGGQNSIDYVLTLFDNEPTKFANFVNHNDYIKIGGFPVKKTTKNESIMYESIPASKPNNTIYANGIFDYSNWQQNIDNFNKDKDVKKYEIPNSITYIKNGYTSMINVAEQLIFNNLNLEKGSSGSIAINSNLEVVGIYWGVYTFDKHNEKGAIDLFKSDKTIYPKTKNIVKYKNISQYGGMNQDTSKNPVLKPYNIINDFKTKLF